MFAAVGEPCALGTAGTGGEGESSSASVSAVLAPMGVCFAVRGADTPSSLFAGPPGSTGGLLPMSPIYL